MRKILLLCLCCLLSSCMLNKQDEYDRQIEKMNLREKIGQLFIVHPDSLNFELQNSEVSNPFIDGITALNETFLNNYQEYPVGGFIMFAKNIENPAQITSFNRSLKDNSKIAPLIAVDEEGGAIARLANNENFNLTKFPNVGLLEEKGINPHFMGNVIGQYLYDYGFNIDFAPVADVNTNPDNPVIGERAFGSDPLIVKESTMAFATGLQENHIIPVYKHFPGHGDTGEDSHYGLAFTNKTAEEMADCEWIPFSNAEDAIMVGHISAPNITDSKMPSTFSSIMLQDILRDQLGFKGVIITDSLDMGAVANFYTPEKAVIKAIEAGCDILLMPRDLRRAFDGLVDAVQNNVISEARIDESVKRVLILKDKIK